MNAGNVAVMIVRAVKPAVEPSVAPMCGMMIPKTDSPLRSAGEIQRHRVTIPRHI